jgi:hypothetical protein
MVRIAGEYGWLEIAPGEDQETFDARASVGDFSGRNPRVGIGADVQRRFLHDLRGVERDRRGEARLQSMSPEDLEVVVRVVDAPGHVWLEGQIGRLRHTGKRYDRLLVKFAFEIDPSRLPVLMADVAGLFRESS